MQACSYGNIGVIAKGVDEGALPRARHPHNSNNYLGLPLLHSWSWGWWIIAQSFMIEWLISALFFCLLFPCVECMMLITQRSPHPRKSNLLKAALHT